MASPLIGRKAMHRNYPANIAFFIKKQGPAHFLRQNRWNVRFYGAQAPFYLPGSSFQRKSVPFYKADGRFYAENMRFWKGEGSYWEAGTHFFGRHIPFYIAGKDN